MCRTDRGAGRRPGRGHDRGPRRRPRAAPRRHDRRGPGGPEGRRRDRRVRPLPAGREPRRAVGEPARRAGQHHRGAPGPVGRRGAPQPRQESGRSRVRQVGRLSRRRAGLRRRPVPHLAPGGGSHRPAEPAVPGELLGGPGGRRVHPGPTGDDRRAGVPPRRRCLRRRDVRRVPVARGRGAVAGQPGAGQQRVLVHRQPGVVLLRLPGTQRRRRHRLFRRADRRAPGRRVAARRQLPGRRRRWRQRAHPPEQVLHAQPGAVRLQRRALPQLRRRR